MQSVLKSLLQTQWGTRTGVDGTGATETVSVPRNVPNTKVHKPSEGVCAPSVLGRK